MMMRWALPAAAELKPAQAAAPEERVELKTVTGDVVYVGKQAISVEYASTKKGGFEMLLPLSSDTALVRLRSLEELKRGDTVKVRYEQTSRETDKKDERVILKTIAREIALIRHAPTQGFSSREQPLE